MLASLLRIAFFAALGFGAYKLYPQYQPMVQKQLENPAILGANVAPVIDKINDLLPENLQIPTPTPSGTSGDVKGEATTITPPPIIQKVIEEVKIKTNEIAQEQLDQIKKEAGQQFCRVLIEKIETECASP